MVGSRTGHGGDRHRRQERRRLRPDVLEHRAHHLRAPAGTAWLAAGLLALALVVRLIAIAHYPYTPINDARSYLHTAFEIARHGMPVDHNHGAGGTHGPTAYFPPAFSYLLSVVDLTIHGRTFGPVTIHGARVVQALLGTATVGLIGLIARELFGVRTALIAMALAAFYPVFIELSTIIVAENLLTVLELGTLYAVLRARRAPAPTRWVGAAGGLLGLSALTHTNAALLIIPAAFGLRGVATRIRRLPAFVTMAVVALLTVTPWLIRDAVVFHRFVPISTETGITLVGAYNPVSAASNPPYRWHLYYDVPSLASIHHEVHHLNEVQLSNRLESAAFSYIGRHPLAPLSVAWHNTLRLLELEGSYAWKASAAAMGLELGVARIGVWSFWLLLICAIAGIATRTARGAPGWVWGFPLVMWLTVVFINAETPRFREPIDPYLVLIAATFLEAAIRWVGRSRASGPATEVT